MPFKNNEGSLNAIESCIRLNLLAAFEEFQKHLERTLAAARGSGGPKEGALAVVLYSLKGISGV